MKKWMAQVVLCLLAAVMLNAQTDSSSLRVLVTDGTGSPIPGAAVKLTNVAKQLEFSRLASGDGYALFTPIPRGSYTVEVAAQGFGTKSVTDLVLDVDDRRLLRVDLAVASIQETVEVTADTATIQTEQGSLGQVIKGEVAVELPLAGRRYTELALLAPGVTASTLNVTTRGPGWFVSNGNYHTQNNFMIDGVDNNQGTQNAQSLSAQVVQPSPDALQEFKVQTNAYSAEFGRSAGAVVNVSIKSGSNDVHGSGWYFNRDSVFAANRWQSNLNGQPKDVLSWHQFGGTVGGPVVKNKLFYFGHYEGFRQNFSDTGTTTVPLDINKQGTFNFDVRDPLASNAPFANRTIPSARFDSLGRKLIDLYPSPNQTGNAVTGGRIVNNYGVQLPGVENTHKYDVRSDYYANDRNQIMVRYSYLRQDISREQIFPGLADGVGNQGSQFNNNHSLATMWTTTISPTMTNTLRFGHNRTFSEFAHATANSEKADAFGFRGFPQEMLQVGGLPLIAVSNYNQLGTRNFRPQFQQPRMWQFIDTLGLVAGNHSIRTGFEFRAKRNNFVDVTRRTPSYSLDGRFTNDSMGDLLLGMPWQVVLNTVPEVDQRQEIWAGFFQDDWKLTRTLTLNLGVRYEYVTPYYGAGQNRNVNFDPSRAELVFASDSDKYLVTPDRNNWGPRLGMAWQIFENKLVLRSGFGMFYSGEDIYGSEANLPLNPPNFVQVGLQQQGLGNPAPVLLSQALPSDILTRFNTANLALRTREREQQSATIYQYNVALEYRLAQDSTLELAYVGNRGRNLFALYQSNQTPFGVDGSIPANRPFPMWQGVQVGASRANSSYDALQLRYEKRFSKGWYTLLSYTYSSAIDEAGAWSEGSSPQFLDDFRAERGFMRQNPRQRLSVAGVWELPFGRGKQIGQNWGKVTNAFLGGWQISSIVSARTGLPLNVGLNGTGVDPRTGQTYRFFGRNGGGLRPNRIGEANTGIDPKVNRLQFLDIGAYAVQPINTPGNAQRNSAYSPEFWQIDANIVKRFRVTESQHFDLRFEGFNVFNTVNFGNPNTSFGNPAFGTINSAGDARIIQMAIRYGF